MLQHIVQEHDISLEFLDFFQSFSQKFVSLEEAYCAPFTVHESPERLEYMYILKFPEYTGRAKPDEPWSIRQVALYHQIRLLDQRSTYVLLTPVPNHVAEKTISEWLNALSTVTECKQQALMPNEILTGLLVETWRFYLMHYEREIEEMSLRMRNEGVQNVDSVTPEDMANLHLFESKLLPVDTLLASLITLFDSLTERYTSLNSQIANNNSTVPLTTPTQREWKANLVDRKNQIAACKNNAQVLRAKCTSVAAFLNGLLNLRNQKAIEKQSSFVLDLSTSTFVITAIFLVYLSFTAVAAIMAMPFFTLVGEKSKHLFVSPSLWIYIAVSLPLTALTIGYWQWGVRRKRLERERKLNPALGEKV